VRLLSITPKIAILAVLIRVFVDTSYDFMLPWQKNLIFCSIASMVLGAFAAGKKPILTLHGNAPEQDHGDAARQADEDDAVAVGRLVRATPGQTD